MYSVCSRIVGQPGTRVPGAVSPAESHTLTGWLVYFNSDNERAWKLRALRYAFFCLDDLDKKSIGML